MKIDLFLWTLLLQNSPFNFKLVNILKDGLEFIHLRSVRKPSWYISTRQSTSSSVFKSSQAASQERSKTWVLSWHTGLTEWCMFMSNSFWSFSNSIRSRSALEGYVKSHSDGLSRTGPARGLWVSIWANWGEGCRATIVGKWWAGRREVWFDDSSHPASGCLIKIIVTHHTLTLKGVAAARLVPGRGQGWISKC